MSRKLRALWTLHVTGGLSEAYLLNLLNDSNEYLRSWTVQLLAENKSVSDQTMKRFEEMATSDNSPLVRLYLTSAMMRLQPEKRWEVMENLTKHETDKDDHNLPLMYWYAMEPLAEIDPEKALKLAESSKIPLLITYTIQRVGAIKSSDSRAALEKLKTRSGHNHSHQNHMNLELINKLLAE